MKNKVFIILLVFGSSLFFSACNDKEKEEPIENTNENENENNNENENGNENGNENENETTAKLLPSIIKITEDGETYTYKYFYDEQNRIKNIDEYNGDNALMWRNKVSYNSKGRPSKWEEFMIYEDTEYPEEEYTVDFLYEGEKLSLVYNDDIKNETWTLNDNGLPVATQGFYYFGLPINTTYTYDENGNAVYIKAITEDESYQSETTYTYDDKNGVFSAVNNPLWFLMSNLLITEGLFNYVNNSTKYEQKTLLEDFPYTSTINTSCTYNSDDYPSMITISLFGDINTDDDDTSFYDAKIKKVSERKKTSYKTSESGNYSYTISIEYIEAKK